MKVLHLISGGDTGGAKTHILTLLSGISREITADMVCFMHGEFSRDAVEMGIPITVLDGGMPSAIRRLKAMAAEGGYDLIHSHGSRGNFYAAILRRLTGLPVISTVHSDYKLDYMGRPGARMTYGVLNAMALRSADYLIGVSDTMRDILISRGFKPNRVYSIYNGVDFGVPAVETDRAKFFRSVGLNADENSVVVGIAARLNPVKDMGTLLRGFAAAAREHPELWLIIAGDGPEEAALRALAAELGVADRVCFAGWLEDVDAFNAAIDINALTSLSETFPYALTEGARAKLPTVATRVGGVPKLILHNETGLLIEPGDWKALGAALSRLAGDAGLRRRLGDALYDKAASEFSLEATWARQLEIYRAVLRRQAVKRGGGREGVLVCGAYGRGNAGDDAILEAIIRSLRGLDRDMPITVMSRRPKETQRQNGVDALHSFAVLRILRLMRRTRLYLNGGGSLIQDVTSRRSLFYYLYSLSAAKKRGCRVIMYGCGIGPVNYPADRRLAARVISSSVDAVTLREDSSLRELRDMGVEGPEIILASDPALTLPCARAGETDECMARFGLTPGRPYVAFALRHWRDSAPKAPIFAAAARLAWEKYGATPVFLSINHRSDGEAADAVTRLLGDTPFVVIREPLGSALTIGLMSRMQAVVSMRLHGLIFAAGQGVPLVGVSYDPKVTAFMGYIGQPLCVELAELTEPGLCGLLESAMALAPERERLAASAAALAELEHRNIDAAKKLLET